MNEKLFLLLFIVVSWLGINAVLAQQVIGVHGGSLPLIPVIYSATPSVTLPATNGQAINTMTATNTPTSWAPASPTCSPSCTGYFALNISTGAVTVTSTGATAIDNTPATYTLSGIIASNAAGSSAAGTDTITFASIPVGYYVSLTGSDSNDGLAATTGGGHGPFATFGKAQTAMQGGSTKTTYIEPGTYTLTAGSYTQAYITLTSADSGETWAGDPNNPWSSVVIDGSLDFGNIWLDNGGSNITWTNFTIKNVVFRGIAIHGGASKGDTPTFNTNIATIAIR